MMMFAQLSKFAKTHTELWILNSSIYYVNCSHFCKLFMYLKKIVFRNAVGKLNSRLDDVEIEIQIQRNWNAEQKEIMKER